MFIDPQCLHLGISEVSDMLAPPFSNFYFVRFPIVSFERRNAAISYGGGGCVVPPCLSEHVLEEHVSPKMGDHEVREPFE